MVGFDNAHPVPMPGSRFRERPSAIDHRHRTESDPGWRYAFEDAATLLRDFFREVRRVTPPLGEAFDNAVRAAGLDLVEVYVRGREFEDLYQLAEALIEWDERITMWRIRHYKVVARVIGDQVVGTQGTPVEVLGKMIHHNFFPALWRARNQLTARAKEEEAQELEAEVPGHGA